MTTIQPYDDEIDKTTAEEELKQEPITVTIVPFTHGAAKSFAIVEVRVVIVMLYDIDTQNEKFSAEIYIESKWVFHSEVEKIHDVTKVPANWKPVWKPELCISNMLLEYKSETWYKIGQIDEKKYVFEMSRIKGTFYGKLLMQNYPFDVQRLYINMFSSSSTSRCLLMKNMIKESSVLVEHFRDSQEWILYNYVGADENGKLATKYGSDDIEHSTINFYCVIARKPNYFVWNAFYLIFLISLISFGIFSIDYTLVNSRLHAQNTLILTSVSFKWVINRNLPAIAYLTILDFYSITSITYMGVVAVFHAIIGFQTSTDTTDDHLFDTYMFVGSGGGFGLLHVFFLIWIWFGVYGPRRLYSNLERAFIKTSKKKSKITKFF